MSPPSRPIFRRIVQIAAVLLSLSMAAFYVLRSQRSANKHQGSSPAVNDFTVVQSTKRSGSIATTPDNVDGLLKGPLATDAEPSQSEIIELDPKDLEEFEGFINYGTPIQTQATDAHGQPVTIILGTKSIHQPIFSTRKVKENEQTGPAATPPATEPPMVSPAPPPPPP